MTRHAVFAIACFTAGLAAQAPDRQKPPVPGPAPALALPSVQKRSLPNGLPVWFVEMHEVPVAQVTLVVKSGSAGDPPGQYGIASMTASMLTEGAGTRTSLELADAIDFLGASITTASTVDSASVRLQVPVARLADALTLMADVALRPAFPKEELERVRQQRLVSLLQARDDPSTIASLAFSRVIYGPAHRFGVAPMGTAATIRAFTPETLRTFYSATYRPDNAALLVVGDLAPDRVMPEIAARFGGWSAPPGPPNRVALPQPPAHPKRAVYLVDKPGAAQSQVRIGSLGVARSTPDYFPLQVMNTVLGGSFTSRLNLNLREKRGYSYGAGSVFDMRAAAGSFSASAGVQTDKTSESLTEFFNELGGILRPVPDDELARAKGYIALRFPGGFETSGDVSRRLEEAIVYGLPDTYFGSYVTQVQSVSATDAQRVARAYLHPERMAVVVVGDSKVIEPGIRALNLGPINTIEIADIFGPQ
jgi:zinc protease